MIRMRAGFLALCALLACACARAATPGHFILEIELANERGGAAQLFYDIGQWYSVRDSTRLDLPANATLRPHAFRIPAKPIRRLRFDPADGMAFVRVGQLRLLTDSGVELARFGPDRLVPMHSIRSLRIVDGVATIETDADDPMVLIARPLQRETAQALGRRTVTRPQILILAAMIGGLLLLGAFGAARSVGGTWHGAPDPCSPRHPAWWLAGTFFAVFGARLWWLKHYSRPMPFWDEWKTTGIDLLMPLGGGYLDWETLFLPHGEHRILLTRLIALGGSLVNGEWDPRVAMTAGAFFFAGGIALLCTALARGGGWFRAVLAAALAAWACLPFDTRNLFWGDQSQMYALNFLGICSLAIAATPKVTRLTLFGGAAAALVSLFTMGSGFIAPGLAAGICLLRCVGEREQRPRLAALAMIFFGCALAGLALYREAPFQGSGYARTWAQFWPAFVGRAAWPLPAHGGFVAFVWLPCALLLAAVARERRIRFLDWIALGTAAWSLLTAIGLAHGRAQETPPFDSKYYTAMSMTAVAALLCAGALLSHWPARRAPAIVALLAALVTTAAMFPLGAAGVRASQQQFGDRLANDDLVRPFLATGDPARLRATPWSELPYWNGAELADLLDDPLLQPWLPAALRQSLAQRPNGTVRGAQSPGWLTLAARTLMKAGPFLFVAGCVAFLWAAVSWRRRAPGSLRS